MGARGVQELELGDARTHCVASVTRVPRRGRIGCGGPDAHRLLAGEPTNAPGPEVHPRRLLFSLFSAGGWLALVGTLRHAPRHGRCVSGVCTNCPCRRRLSTQALGVVPRWVSVSASQQISRARWVAPVCPRARGPPGPPIIGMELLIREILHRSALDVATRESHIFRLQTVSGFQSFRIRRRGRPGCIGRGVSVWSVR